MSKLCDLEIELLRDMNGEKTSITGWGSWMGDAVETLKFYGYVTRERTADGIAYVINDAGRSFLAALTRPADGASDA